MQHFPALQKIIIKQIDLSDEWNLHPFLGHKPSSRLQHSIHAIGLLHPPILQECADKRYRLICGRNRLRVIQAEREKSTEINALILDKDVPPQRVLHYVLEDQLLSGTLSPMEKLYFFKYCLNYMEMEDAAQYFFTALGEKVQSHLITRMLPLLDLELEIQKSIHLGKVGEKLALELQQLTPDDRLALFKIFQKLILGGGKQKRLWTLTRDLAFRHGKTISSLLAEPDISFILDHPEMNGPQKASALLTLLQKRVTPESSAAEESFQQAVSAMQLPPTAAISHSPAFEKNEVYVTLRFETLAEVEGHLQEITALAARNG